MHQKIKLKNGLKLVLAPLKETKAVTVLVLLPVGSRYETKPINGVSHFVEHLMFKGTTKRPTSLDITKELDSVGAEYNAFTGKDHTGYYIKVAADRIELAFDILSDMLFDSVFDEAEINKERGVIIEEINMYTDNPLMYLGALFEQTLFGDHPLGWLISGPKKVIRQVTRRQILDYKAKHYQPSNMVLTVAGNFKTAEVKKLTDRYFGIKSVKAGKNNFKRFNAKQAAPKISLLYKDTEQVQLGLGFPAFAITHPDIFALYVLAVILGGNMSSRLFVNVREKHGLAYYIRTDLSAYLDAGDFLVQAGLDRRRIKQAITLIIAELKSIRDNGITAKELKSAKAFLRGKLILDLEDSENIADWYGKQVLLLDKTYTPAERLNKISAVTAKDVKRVAERIFKTSRFNLAMIGPFKDKGEFKKLLKF